MGNAERHCVWSAVSSGGGRTTPCGRTILDNFLFGICRWKPSWTMKCFRESVIKNTSARPLLTTSVILRTERRVSTVRWWPYMLHQALAHGCIASCQQRVTAQGRSRRGPEGVPRSFRNQPHLRRCLGVIPVPSQNVTDPNGNARSLATPSLKSSRSRRQAHQCPIPGPGNLVSGCHESVSFKGPSATIKTHHNVGGLPDRMQLKLVEPLRELFKDEVRLVGRSWACRNVSSCVIRSPDRGSPSA